MHSLDPNLFLQAKKTYKILDLIGEGSYGSVYQGKHRASGKAVALKFVKFDYSCYYACKLALREMSLLRQLSSMKDNIFTANLLDIIVTEHEDKPISCFCLVMDLECLSVDQLLKNNAEDGFSSKHIKVLVYNLLCSVNFLHTAGIMHRDIKPGNILLDAKCAIKICDFGQAR